MSVYVIVQFAVMNDQGLALPSHNFKRNQTRKNSLIKDQRLVHVVVIAKFLSKSIFTPFQERQETVVFFLK